MNWIECPEIEIVAGRLSGAAVLKGSRVRPSDLLLNADRGAEWLADAHQLPLHQVQAVLAFYELHSLTLAPAL